MTFRTLALAAAAALAAPLAGAQTLAMEPAARGITVVGEGVASASPDLAVVRLGVTTRAATAAEALRAHEADMARVLDRVRSFGIDDRDITIESLMLGDFYGPNGPDGYQAVRVVSVTTGDLARVPDLVASVVGEGANRLDGLVYTLRDAEPLTLRALDLAMAQARAKAERLAAAAGLAIVGVEAVEEQVGGLRPPLPVTARAQAMDGAGNPAAYSTGSAEVRVAVTVRFATAPAGR